VKGNNNCCNEEKNQWKHDINVHKPTLPSVNIYLLVPLNQNKLKMAREAKTASTVLTVSVP
jgi:hypothetical protein